MTKRNMLKRTLWCEIEGGGNLVMRWQKYIYFSIIEEEMDIGE